MKQDRKLKLFEIRLGNKVVVVLAQTQQEAVFKLNKPWSSKCCLRKIEEFR